MVILKTFDSIFNLLYVSGEKDKDINRLLIRRDYEIFG